MGVKDTKCRSHSQKTFEIDLNSHLQTKKKGKVFCGYFNTYTEQTVQHHNDQPLHNLQLPLSGTHFPSPLSKMANAARHLFFHPHIHVFNQEKSDVVLYFLSHPPKRFAPHTQGQTTGAGLDSGAEAACPCPHTDAPLPFGTKVLNTPLQAHSSSGLWAGSKRGAGPIVQHLQESFVSSARRLPVPCCAGTRARHSALPAPPACTSCPQRASSRMKWKRHGERAEAAALPERDKICFIQFCRLT